MRGVIALAAALSLPEHLADGSPFPQRNLIIFLTFSVILVTLVLQGLILSVLIWVLGLVGSSGTNCEETEARRIMAEAALKQLNKTSKKTEPDFAGLYDDLKEHYRRRLSSLPREGESYERTLHSTGLYRDQDRRTA